MSSGDHSSFNFSIDPTSPSADEYFKSIEERVNNKIATGMKKAVHLILQKFEAMLQERVQLMIVEEIDKKIKHIGHFKSSMEAHAPDPRVFKLMQSPRTTSLNRQVATATATPEKGNGSKQNCLLMSECSTISSIEKEKAVP